MAKIEPGWKSSEFRYGGLVGALTIFGDQLGIFDTSVFADDPVLMLIYRGVQLMALAAVAVSYIWGRSQIKTWNGNGNASPPDNKTSREG